MRIGLAAVIIDAADLETESTFWKTLLDGSVTATPTHHFVVAEGVPPFVIQLAPEQVAPRWPDAADQQVHVDLTTDDLVTADQRALAAGASRKRPLSKKSGVYVSPAGHPFCLRAA